MILSRIIIIIIIIFLLKMLFKFYQEGWMQLQSQDWYGLQQNNGPTLYILSLYQENLSV